MSLLNIVKTIIPETWVKGDGSYNGRFIISDNKEEYDDVEKFVNTHVTGPNKDIDKVERVQNLSSYGKYMLRKEQLGTYSDEVCMVRKLAKIDADYLQIALKYNLDYRRLKQGAVKYNEDEGQWDEEVELHDFIYDIEDHEVLLIVNVLCEDNEDVNKPTVYFSKNMYIEYIVHLS